MTDTRATNEQQSSDPLLTVENISHSFGSVSVLDDVSFQVPPNTVIAVIGPNGSGKTTLSRIVASLLSPSDGTISLRTDAERQIGYLPQEPQFRPVFTVEETLQFYGDLLTDAETPSAAMERVGLADVGDRRVDALSGGMRRLLGIAQSFLGSPPLVVLDEPTSGLDPRMTRQIFDVVTASATGGTSVFLTTHDLTYAAEADLLVILHQGRIVAQGTPDELLVQTSADTLADAFFSVVGTKPAVQTGSGNDNND